MEEGQMEGFESRPRASSQSLSGVDQAASLELPASDGARRLPDRDAFDRLARRDDVPGALGAREVKVLMTGVDGPSPQLFFMNTVNTPFHYEFATKVLRMGLSLGEFNSRTYFRDDRQNLAGSIIAHDNFDGEARRGLYSLEFWPTDPVGVAHVALAFASVSEAMPFAKGILAYHPAGDTQEALYAREEAEYRRRGVRVISTDELFGGVSFSALNLGEGFGLLRLVGGSSSDLRPPTVRDVVVFETLPNDLPHVGGVISETPQTPLSHINLKAKQNDTPNAFVRGASTHPRVVPLASQVVRYEVTPDDFELELATSEQAEAWLEKVRPPEPQSPRRDLSATEILDLDLLGHGAVPAFGAKTANVGELRKILPAQTVPDGFGIPFYLYDRFMAANGLYEEAARMAADASFRADPAIRERVLDDFREAVREADVPPELARRISELQALFPEDLPLRCRSSTNNEDVEGFNGAGLYDSFTHRPDEGDLSETVKQVWASMWNYRAFEEREFHRVDHRIAAMGVLVHPNFDDELANGVAVTKNIYAPDWRGFYINAQVGESLVTNPDPNATPDEVLISAIGPNREYEIQYIRHSSLTLESEEVLTRSQLLELTRAMEIIQEHFKVVYGRQADDAFAMDIEFKIDAGGGLIVKQARPWVE
jgi:pyruvate, water dikinase